jgi:hypothetical protein
MSNIVKIVNVLLPSFVMADTTTKTLNCSCKGCGDVPSTFDDFNALEGHLSDMKVTWFNCPVPNCPKMVPTLAGVITAHIRDKHPKIATSMNLTQRGRTAIYCKECDKYTTMLHYHCKECAKENTRQFFKSKEELDNHLTTVHTKWWFEKRCKYDMECQGHENGSCGFNHYPLHDPETNFLPANTVIPDTVCPFDKPWDNKRCKNMKCNLDHFWGRVRWMIKQRKTRQQKNIHPATRPVHPERPDFSDEPLHTANNSQHVPLTAAQLNELAYMRGMHEAGWLDKEYYYGGTQVSEEQGANAYEEGEYQEGEYQEGEYQEEDEYADMPSLVPHTTA